MIPSKEYLLLKKIFHNLNYKVIDEDESKKQVDKILKEYKEKKKQQKIF